MNKKCVLIGYLGHGKTTLFNKICNQNQQADSELSSNTLEIRESKARFGYGFIILDTPGLGAINNIFQHTTTIIAALTEGPINGILLVLKCESRMDMIQNQISDLLPLVKDYLSIVTIILTHIDQIKKHSDQRESSIKDMIKKEFKIQNVLFSSDQTDGPTLCLNIENILDSKQMVLKFTDNQIDDLMIKLEFNPELRNGKEDFLAQFNKFYHTVKEFLKEFQPNVEDQDQILHHLHIFVRNGAQKIQEKFESTYGPTMERLHQKKNDPVEAYYFHTVLKNSIRNQLQELIELIDKKMIYPENHPYRTLRKCRNCGLIWQKVIGCDDVTCGTREQEQDEGELKLLKKKQAVEKNYEFIYKNGKLVYKELLNRNYLNQNLQRTHEFGRYIGGFHQFMSQHLQRERGLLVSRDRIIGCGANFNWNEAPILRLSELRLQHEALFKYLSNKDQLYKHEYEEVRQQLINQVLRQKKQL